MEDNKLTVYENSNEEYFTFITQECRKAIDNYIDFRQRYHEKIKPESWLIREQFDVRNPGKPRQVIHKTLQWNIRMLAIKCGIRKTAPPHDVKVGHGFRKFFTTQLIKSNIKAEARLALEGHSSGLGITRHYWRPTEKEMYYEYEKAIDNLTINEENRLRKKVEKLEVEKSEYENLSEEIKLIKRELFK